MRELDVLSVEILDTSDVSESTKSSPSMISFVNSYAKALEYHKYYTKLETETSYVCKKMGY